MLIGGAVIWIRRKTLTGSEPTDERSRERRLSLLLMADRSHARSRAWIALACLLWT
jgi:hypothetical protein